MVQGVDYRVPMSAQGLDLNGAIDHYYKYQQNKRQNALLDLTSRQKEQEMAEAEKQRIGKSIAGFALQIQPYLEARDQEGAMRIYSQRINGLQAEGKNPSDSMELAPYLMSGDLESANIMAKNAIQYGREMGYLRGSEPDELKVGRFRQITLPDGTMATLDTATNQMKEIAAAPSIDLSVVPEEIRDGVSKLPRDQQVKIAEQYATPKAQQDISDKAAQKEKSEQVTNDTRRLVTELINNESGLRSAIGGVDEFFPTFSDSTKDAEAALDDLRNLLTVDNLKLMSGVLSESDIKILASVGANGLSGSDDRVWASLNRMAQALGIKSNAGGGKAEGENRTRGSYTSSSGITFEVE